MQLSDAIGVAKTVSLFVDTFRKEMESLTADIITNALKIDCRRGAIAVSLALREPKYQDTAA